MSPAAAAVLPKPQRRDPDEAVLPHNLEAERSTLGAALITHTAADFIADKLTSDAYFRRAHQAVFRAIVQLRENKSEVDFVTLKAELNRVGQLDEVGGPAYISSLVDGVPETTNVQYYADILRDLQTKRNLVYYAERTIDHVYENSQAAQAILNDADRRLMDLQQGHVTGRMKSLADTHHDRFASLEWRHEHKGELRGVTSGYQSIDDLTLGWRSGDLCIIAARTSIGKTTLVMNCAVHAARSCRRASDEKRRVAIFSLEMRREQLEDRILSQLSGVAVSRISSGHLAQKDFEALSPALVEMNELSIHIDDRSGQSAIDIRGACRRLQAEGGVDLVVIDYVQQMPGTLERRGSTRNEELTDISRRVKDLADEVSAPVILLSQLKRTEGRPRLDDLRESGALEQAADVVGLLHRKDHRISGTTEFILAKQRNGPTGTVNLTIDRDTTTFTDGGETPEPTPEEKETERKAHAKRGAIRKRRGED